MMNGRWKMGGDMGLTSLIAPVLLVLAAHPT